ncbi:MAG: hypothetical protein OEM27_00150 [Nitrospinota bacterium]|nr:hypothetical protein [Nitrospinota bacterium]
MELEPLLDDPEPIEIVVEDEAPADSLEKEALDDIWNQAVREGARTTGKSKGKFPTPPSQEPVAETVDEVPLEEPPSPPQNKSKQLPSLEDRQREIDQMIAGHQPKQGESEEKSPTGESHPSLPQKEPQAEKTQEEIDLDEQVIIDEGEVIPSWEEAFAHQAKIEAGWKKAQEQDKIHEEQQLAETLAMKALPTEPPKEETATTDLKDDKQSLVDEIFAEAKAQKEKTQEEIDLDESVVIDKEEAIPSWEEAFADQAKVEAGWRKAKEQDQIHEEQQLAEALGEKYIPSESAPGETPAAAEDPQAVVDDIFAKMKSQAQTTDQPSAEEPPVSTTKDADTPAKEEPEPTWTDAFDDQSKTESTWKKPEEQESEAASVSTKEEDIPLDSSYSSDIDLAVDMMDMDMKQLVEQAFEEERKSDEGKETPEPKKAETPTVSEATPEPTLEMETPPETPAAEPSAPVSQEEEYINQTIDYYADYTDPADAPEDEPIPELTLESAEEKPVAEPMETVAQEKEPETEPEIEIELEPELTLESSEATLPSAVQPAKNQETSFDKESEELWADLIPDQKAEGEIVNEETPIAFNKKEEEEEPFGGSDFWDQVLEKDSQESQTAETEAVPQPVTPASMPQHTVERAPSTDEELWKQAFPGEEELEPTAAQSPGEENEDVQSNVPPLVIGANVNLNDESEDSLEYDEASYADDDDDFEFQRRKRKLGPFTIPHGRRGDWIVGGAMVVFLLLVGSVYLTLQTFAPGELTDMQTAETEVPEGLTPREVPLDELVGGLTSPKPEKTPTVDTPGDKGEAILSDPSKILEESPEEKGILKDLAESQILKDTGKSQTARIDQSSLQALSGHSVTLSTIMPVAYNPTDIRVLSFSVEMQLSDAQSAKMVRESLPVYEEIMNQTVEDLLRRKFYNDILYVKEKLQKRLQTAMNQSLKNGRVRKTKFVDFAIQ